LYENSHVSSVNSAGETSAGKLLFQVGSARRIQAAVLPTAAPVYHPEAEEHNPGMSSLLLHQLQGVYAVKVCVVPEPNYGAYFEDHLSIFPYLLETQVCE
jgi:hypothetical protein